MGCQVIMEDGIHESADHFRGCMLVVAQGYSCGEVARLLGDAPRTDWVHRFEEWGLSGFA